MFNIIYGTDSASIENTAYDRIKNVAASGRCAWILVPEQFSLSAESFVIKTFGVAAQTNIKVITFSRLCNLVLSKLGPLRLRYIDGAGKQIVAAATVRDVKSKLGVLSSAVRRRGFSSELTNLVSEFKRYGVSPQALSEAAGSASENQNEQELSEKLKDISVMYDTFNRFMEDKAADAEDNLSIICNRLKHFDFGDGCLFIMHFRSFTPVEYRAIGEIMQSLDVCAVMCCDDIKRPSALFAPISDTCRKLTEIAAEHNTECEEPMCVFDRDNGRELTFLRKAYFSPTASPRGGKTESVFIKEVSNHYREAETAADLILRLCRTENRRFSDFLILARRPEDYLRIIPPIFGSRGIDVFLDSRRSIITKPLAEMLCASLEILAYGWSYERVMTIARSGMTTAKERDIDEFENYILAADPSYAMWAESVWTFKIPEFDLEKINEVRRCVCSFPNRLAEQLSGRKTAAQICKAILECMKADNLAERTAEICKEFDENSMPYLADEYRQVWNGIISVLSQISALMDSENITWQDFADLFKSSCGGISVGITPQTQDCAIFAGIDRFRAEDTPVVIVLGMTDGVFPAPHTEEGLISDAERIKLENYGISLAPGADAKAREEQLLVYSVLTAAAEKLYLFVPMLDTDGAQMFPSPIIKRIRTKVFSDIKITNPDRTDNLTSGAEGREAVFGALCGILAKCGGEVQNLNGTAEELYKFFKTDAEYSERLKKVIESMKSPEPELLTRKNVRAIYGDVIALSATKLEKYNDCAFSYFMRYGLVAKERVSGKLDSRDTGSIQHNALYRYFSELKFNDADYGEITYDRCRKRVCEIVEQAAKENSELLYESSFYFKYIVSRMQGIVTRTAWETIMFYKSGAFRPYGYEIKIATGGDIPTICIKADDGTDLAHLHGFIDRADTAVINGKTYVSIIDYKSSKTDLDSALTDAGVKLQPLLYSDIVCKRLNASPAAMLYMQMTDPIIKAENLKSDENSAVELAKSKEVDFGGWVNNDAAVIANYSNGENGETFLPSKNHFMSESEMTEHIEKANENIKNAARGIYKGNISAKPFVCKGHSACTYCPYSLSCSKEE